MVYDRPSDRGPTLLTKIFRAFLQPIDLVLELPSIHFLQIVNSNFLLCALSCHCTAIKEWKYTTNTKGLYNLLIKEGLLPKLWYQSTKVQEIMK